MEFPAGDAGVRDLRVAIDAAPGETRVANNERHAVMQVDGRRRSVLYVEGEPRWEYKFIRRAVEGDRVIRLASAVRATPNRYYRQGLSNGDELESGFPATISELYGYDAVIIGSLEAAALSEDQQQWLKGFVDKRGGSLLMLAGRDGLGDGGWSRVAIAPLLPAKLPGGSDRSYSVRKSQVRLTPYGRESVVGRLAPDEAANEKAWKELPPLTDYQELGPLRPGAVVLLETATGEKVSPLLVTQRYGRGSTWLLATPPPGIGRCSCRRKTSATKLSGSSCCTRWHPRRRTTSRCNPNAPCTRTATPSRWKPKCWMKASSRRRIPRSR